MGSSPIRPTNNKNMAMNSTKQSPIFYDVDYYASRKEFSPPKLKNGLRKVNPYQLWILLTVFISSFAILVLYLSQVSATINSDSGATGNNTLLLLTSIGGAAIALPLATLLVWITRRYLVQPIFTYVVPFMFGATIAVGLSLIASVYVTPIYNSVIINTGVEPMSFLATVHAPIFEELFKGLGLALMFLVFRNFFRTPHDGVIYGMLIGIGFAFTENVQYFIQHGSTTEGFWMLLLSRVFGSLLTHATFTAATGLVMGWAIARFGNSGMKIFLGWLIGLTVAIAGHALWNGSSSVGFFVPSYLFIFLPLFITVTTLMTSTARHYDSLFNVTLARYETQGWFSNDFYKGIFPKLERKKTLKRLNSKEKKKLRLIASNLSELVYVRHNLDTHKGATSLQEREKELLVALFLEQRVKIQN